MHGQLLISRIFDKLRWLLGKMTFATVGQTPTAAAAPPRPHFSPHGSTTTSSRAGSQTEATLGEKTAKSESGGLFSMLRSPRHPAVSAAADAGAVGAPSSFGAGFAAGRRLKLRSVTSVDLPVRSEDWA